MSEDFEVRKRSWLVLVLLLSACSTWQAGSSPPVPRKAAWALLPIVNYSQTPLAGERAEAIVTTLAQTRGLSLDHYAIGDEKNGSLPVLDDTVRYQKGLEWAVAHHYQYALTGSVEEWHYKSGLDGEPAVGLSLRVIELPSMKVVWSASGARTGWGRDSVSGTAQQVAETLLGRLPLK